MLQIEIKEINLETIQKEIKEEVILYLMAMFF